MPQAPRQQTRTIGNLSLLVPAPRPPASAVATCLAILQRDWQRDGHLAALWQAWPRIAGPQGALLSGADSVGAHP